MLQFLKIRRTYRNSHFNCPHAAQCDGEAGRSPNAEENCRATRRPRVPLICNSRATVPALRTLAPRRNNHPSQPLSPIASIAERTCGCVTRVTRTPDADIATRRRVACTNRLPEMALSRYISCSTRRKTWRAQCERPRLVATRRRGRTGGCGDGITGQAFQVLQACDPPHPVTVRPAIRPGDSQRCRSVHPANGACAHSDPDAGYRLLEQGPSRHARCC
jgi:hypothetical protein